MKAYLYSYSHEGSRWSFELLARDRADAERRLYGLKYASLDGEIKAKIRVHSRLDRMALWLARKMGMPALLLLGLSGSAWAHGDWYSGLTVPGTHVSCCNQRDCRPVEVCSAGDREGVVIEGTCMPIPWHKVLELPSPDGEAHACWGHVNGQPELRCLVLGGSA